MVNLPQLWQKYGDCLSRGATIEATFQNNFNLLLRSAPAPIGTGIPLDARATFALLSSQLHSFPAGFRFLFAIANRNLVAL